jgi:uncharacterized protein (DUF736 family)
MKPTRPSENRALVVRVAALLAVLLSAREAEAQRLDPKEILVPQEAPYFRLVSVATRLTAYSQYGNGYQSKAGPIGGPGSQRLTVFEPQLEVVAKQGERLTHRVWVPVDVVSSADAIDRDRRPPDVTSSASRRNEAGTIDWTTTAQASPSTTLGVRNAVHLEEEWRSWTGGLTLGHTFDEQSSTLSLAATTVFDWFDAYDSTGKRIGQRTRSTHTASLGLTRVLTSTTIAEASYGVTLQAGELGNTWNAVPSVGSSYVLEQLPASRLRHAVVGRLAQALPWDGALKVYYRLYTDDWKINAHSLEGQLLQRLTSTIYVGFGYRFHTQTRPDFFTLRAAADAPLRTADSDLDTFRAHAISGRISFDVPLTPPGPRALHADIAFEHYRRTNDLLVNVVTCATGFSF